MTYRFEGNDPNRQRKIRSPDEVRQMMTGGSEEEPEGLLARSYGRGRTISETLDAERAERENKLVEIAPAFTGGALARAKGQARGRCIPCGRKFNCCCQGCPTCPQSKMAPGMISAAWAKRQVDLGGIDPREMC